MTAERSDATRDVTADWSQVESSGGGVSASKFGPDEREWALGVLERAEERLRREFEEGGRRGPFELARRMFSAEEAPPLAQVAREHGMSLPAVKAFLHRTRARFRELVRAEVVETTADGADADAEIERLRRALRP